MRLEGSLDAFSLPDILQLLAFTQKTGALVLRRPGGEGVVRVRGGAVTGASADTSRQALGRRLVGAGLVDDEDLSLAVDAVRATPGTGLGRALVDTGAVSEDTLLRVAGEQVADAVSDLLRWTEGTFEFVLDASDPDGVTLSLPVPAVVGEGQARLEQWPALAAQIPSADTVLALTLNPPGEPACARDEWSLLALVDGRRSVTEIVELAGWGEFAVVRALAGLAERGLLVRADAGDGGLAALLRRQDLVRGLERPGGAGSEPGAWAGAPGPAPADPPPVYDDPYATTAAGLIEAEMAPLEEGTGTEAPYPVLSGQVPQQASPSARDSITGQRAPAPATASVVEAESSGAGNGNFSTPSVFADVARAVVGATSGSAAMAPAELPEPMPAAAVDRDSAVTKSLLLRLIAGVRGL